ncbi:hypothetical protein [Salmonella phage PS3-1]|nr:hypothetical protein [Salmonella phage PS3-1]
MFSIIIAFIIGILAGFSGRLRQSISIGNILRE